MKFWVDAHPQAPVTRGETTLLVDAIRSFVRKYGPIEIAKARIEIEIKGRLAMWFEMEIWTSSRVV